MTIMVLDALLPTAVTDLRGSVETLGGLLDDLAAVVMATPPTVYAATPAVSVSGSVGKHLRHTLDHVASFLEASGTNPLDYDRRQRGTRVEVDPAEALSTICRLQRGLERMAGRSQDERVCVHTQLTPAGKTIVSSSTLGRELAFVVSHTIHHQALIALLLANARDLTLPPRFGYAPSTPLAH